MFAQGDLLTATVLERMLAGVATRSFERVADPIGETQRRAARSTSKSAVSRRFLTDTRAVRRRLVQRLALHRRQRRSGVADQAVDESVAGFAVVPIAGQLARRRVLVVADNTARARSASPAGNAPSSLRIAARNRVTVSCVATAS